MRELIYFVQEGANGPIKIGFTRGLKVRMSCLQTDNSNQLYIIRVVRGGREMERAIHNKLRAFNIRGEWFKSTQSVVDFVAGFPKEGLANQKTFIQSLPRFEDGPAVSTETVRLACILTEVVETLTLAKHRAKQAGFAVAMDFALKVIRERAA